jgi:flavin reductase (DIM6/NTAB) family NADH-FMN oxidoreductase RutF
MKQQLSDLCRQLTLGVYVVGVASGEQHDAFTASAVMQASFDPPLIAVSVNPGHASYPLLRASRGFAISVLRRDQLGLARHFGTRSGRDTDKLRSVAWHCAGSGAPVLDDAMAWLDCEVVAAMPAGDHQIVLGRVIDGRVIEADVSPMLYADTGNMDGSQDPFREHYF